MKHWQVAIVFIALLFGASIALAVVVHPKTSYVEPVKSVETVVATEERSLLDMINELRKEKGVHALVASPELDKSAQEKASDMASQHYFGHVNPQNVRGPTLILKYFPKSPLVSENLASCYDSKATTFQGWVDSPSHYAGMIDSRVTLYGVGTAYDDKERCTIYVNHFAGV